MTSQSSKYTPDQLDALKGILTRGMESAAQVVSEMIGRKVEMSVPDVSLVSCEGVGDVVRHSVEEPSVGVKIGVTGDITGSVMLIFPPPSAYRLVDILMGNEPGTTSCLAEMERSAICEVGNLAGSFFLNFLAEATGLCAMPSPPELDGQTLVAEMLKASIGIGREGPCEDLGAPLGGGREALVAQTVLSQSLQRIEALFLIVPTYHSLATILEALGADARKGSGVT